MGYVTKEQIARAKSVSITEYLLAHEPDNIRCVGKALYLKDHSSLEISNDLWNWHSRNIGGRTVVDYLMKVRGFSFVDAVKHLAGEEIHSYNIALNAKPPHGGKPLVLPPRNCDNDRVIAYLESRGIEKTIVEDCIRREILYESAGYYNCVFIGRDENNVARYATLRGTSGDFKCDADGSDKRFGFCLPPSELDCMNVIVFESPIDALSHKSLYPGIDGFRLSLGGTALIALTQFLETQPQIGNIIVCTDNDEAGNACADKIAENSGYYISRELPKKGKDWNEFLQITRKDENIMEDKRKNIKFITSDYKELFTIKDGESINFKSGYDGIESVIKCRWIDETHTRIGSEDYHICQWAEICERNGHKFEAAKPVNKIDILAAKYGENLENITIPMTEAAIKKLVGGKYDIASLRHQSGEVFGTLVSGKDGIAVCGLTDGVLTSLHTYNVQTCKRELSPAERPPQEVPSKKPSILDELEATQKEAAEQNNAREIKDKAKKRGEPEVG
ncbi:hypothetical protein FACS1894219_03330 [Clostridia bacterium]|nr:hypothetical protein FACS1894219_03330 [Clostridia bacterium]